MLDRPALMLGVLVTTFAAGYACATLGPAHAQPQSAFDRSLAQRLVRAQEEQASEQQAQRRAIESLTRAIEHCKR